MTQHAGSAMLRLPRKWPLRESALALMTKSHSYPRALRLLDEYGKHFALNFGQALQGVRYVYSHPDVDDVAARGTLRHLALSAQLRTKRIVNDLFFAAIPPHWHHTPEELATMTTLPASKWFQYGYCAWRFDLLGEPKPDLSGADKRWDPRCRPRDCPRPAGS